MRIGIDMSDIALDPDFSQPIVIVRQPGIFALGKFTARGAPQNIPAIAIVQPTTPEDLDQVPQGDRVRAEVSFISVTRMYQTAGGAIGSPANFSDQITWNGTLYGIANPTPWGDSGFWKAIGIRLSGA